MRIISGKFKGRNIEFIKSSITRPLKDAVKENIFNKLIHSNNYKVQLGLANILDLYSGVGSFGLECISRGARKVTFLERDKNAQDILKRNLIKLSIINQSKIITNIKYLFRNDLNEKYHIFFLDPPFLDKLFIENLKLIKDKKIFYQDHIIIIHREKNSKDELNKFMKIVEEKNYGRSKIIFATFN